MEDANQSPSPPAPTSAPSPPAPLALPAAPPVASPVASPAATAVSPTPIAPAVPREEQALREEEMPPLLERTICNFPAGHPCAGESQTDSRMREESPHPTVSEIIKEIISRPQIPVHHITSRSAAGSSAQHAAAFANQPAIDQQAASATSPRSSAQHTSGIASSDQHAATVPSHGSSAQQIVASPTAPSTSMPRIVVIKTSREASSPTPPSPQLPPAPSVQQPVGRGTTWLNYRKTKRNKAEKQTSPLQQSQNDIPLYKKLTKNSIKIVTPETIAYWAREQVEAFRQMTNVESMNEAEELLRASHWDMTAAVLAYFNGEKTRRPGRRIWRKLDGAAWCAICFEAKDADLVEVYSTDCAVAVCGPCWGRYFSAMLSGGVRGPLRCPFPTCNSCVPMWLVEACYGTHDADADRGFIEAITEVYRRELASDYVHASEMLAYCPGIDCDRIIKITGTLIEPRVLCECGYDFCFHCLREEHFPVSCSIARDVNTISVHDELKWLALSLHKYKQCGGCGILIENEGGCRRMECTVCKFAQDWSVMQSCEQNVQRSVCAMSQLDEGKIKAVVCVVNRHVIDKRYLNERIATMRNHSRKDIGMPEVLQALRLCKWTAVSEIIEGRPPNRALTAEMLLTTKSIINALRNDPIDIFGNILEYQIDYLKAQIEKSRGMIANYL